MREKTKYFCTHIEPLIWITSKDKTFSLRWLLEDWKTCSGGNSLIWCVGRAISAWNDFAIINNSGEITTQTWNGNALIKKSDRRRNEKASW